MSDEVGGAHAESLLRSVEEKREREVEDDDLEKVRLDDCDWVSVVRHRREEHQHYGQEERDRQEDGKLGLLSGLRRADDALELLSFVLKLRAVGADYGTKYPTHGADSTSRSEASSPCPRSKPSRVFFFISSRSEDRRFSPESSIRIVLHLDPVLCR